MRTACITTATETKKVLKRNATFVDVSVVLTYQMESRLIRRHKRKEGPRLQMTLLSGENIQLRVERRRKEEEEEESGEGEWSSAEKRESKEGPGCQESSDCGWLLGRLDLHAIRLSFFFRVGWWWVARLYLG
jgi:hypothetical protein